MIKFPLNIGIVDPNLVYNNCSTFLITFPTDEEFANDSKIGWNPWGYTFSFVYDFSNGVLMMSDDYTTMDCVESIEDSLLALKVYEDGPEWNVEFREDINSWKQAEYIPSKIFPNKGKWKKHRHSISSNDISFPSSGIEDIIIAGSIESYEEGSNPKIDDFYNYIYGEGYQTLLKVSNAVVKSFNQ